MCLINRLFVCVSCVLGPRRVNVKYWRKTGEWIGVGVCAKFGKHGGKDSLAFSSSWSMDHQRSTSIEPCFAAASIACPSYSLPFSSHLPLFFFINLFVFPLVFTALWIPLCTRGKRLQGTISIGKK